MINFKSELLFCYDIKDANPNGDPMDSNKPRIDEETSINIVTDVRLKRTIRDYLFDYKGYNGTNDKDIFVREIHLDKGIQDGKTRAKDFKEDEKTILNKCIDIRLFGGVMPLDKASITYTGPVQFKMGRSLNKVELKHIKGTGAFASKLGSDQKTFREEYLLHYSFIAFNGIINEVAAKHTNLKEEDITELLDGMWNGTNNLLSRSKVGQKSRVLIKIDYKKAGFFIGDIDKLVKINCENELKIRDVADFTLNISKLLNAINKNIDKIENVYYKIDENVILNENIPENWLKIEI